MHNWAKIFFQKSNVYKHIMNNTCKVKKEIDLKKKNTVKYNRFI